MVNSSLDAETILWSIVRSVTQHSPWRMCWVGLVDLERREFSQHAEAGFCPPLADEVRTWPLESSATLAAIEQGTLLYLPDALEQDTFPLVREHARRYGFRSALIIPLQLGEARGAMWFFAPTAGTFSRTEIAYASAIAAQATVALRNSLLLQRERELRAAEIERASELERVNQVTARQNKLLERLNASHVRLIEMVLAERGLGSLAEAAAQLLGNPVFILDRFHRLLASSESRPFDLSEHAGAGALSERLRRLEYQRRAMFWKTGTGNRILAPVMAGRTVLGYLCVQEISRPFEELDLMVAEQVALLTALELMKERIRLDVELRLKTDFVEVLLAGGNGDSEDLRQRAALLGLDLSRSLQVLLVDIDPFDGVVGLPESPLFDLSSSLQQVVSERLERCRAGAVAVPQGGGRLVIVAAAESDGGETLAAEVRQAVIEAAPKLHGATISVSVGRGYQGSMGVRRSFREAKRALEILRALGQRDTVLPFARAGVYEILLDEDRVDDLIEFARPRLTRLLDYDQRRGSSLLATLEAYLASGCDVAQTAEKLFLHVTTIRYRLGRIRKIMGLDLDDAEQRLNLHLALKIYRLHGQRFKAAATRLD